LKPIYRYVFIILFVALFCLINSMTTFAAIITTYEASNGCLIMINDKPTILVPFGSKPKQYAIGRAQKISSNIIGVLSSGGSLSDIAPNMMKGKAIGRSVNRTIFEIEKNDLDGASIPPIFTAYEWVNKIRGALNYPLIPGDRMEKLKRIGGAFIETREHDVMAASEVYINGHLVMTLFDSTTNTFETHAKRAKKVVDSIESNLLKGYSGEDIKPRLLPGNSFMLMIGDRFVIMIDKNEADFNNLTPLSLAYKWSNMIRNAMGAPFISYDSVRSFFTQFGKASWYGSEFHGRRASSGERYDMNEYTAAHKSLPFGTEVLVTRMDNYKSVIVRITDRGPYIRGRIIDLSKAAAQSIGVGVSDVRIDVIGTSEVNNLRKKKKSISSRKDALNASHNTKVSTSEK